jgi:hypothetical protein
MANLRAESDGCDFTLQSDDEESEESGRKKEALRRGLSKPLSIGLGERIATA